MIEIKYEGDALWERIERAVEIVKQRLRRATEALNAAAVPYAVIGGTAVQHWVAQVDESVVRNTRDGVQSHGSRRNAAVFGLRWRETVGS